MTNTGRPGPGGFAHPGPDGPVTRLAAETTVSSSTLSTLERRRSYLEFPQSGDGPAAAFLQDIGLPALTCDAQGRITGVSSKASSLLGPSAMPGADLADLASGDKEELRVLWPARCHLGVGWGHQTHLCGGLGTEITVSLLVIPVKTNATETLEWLVLLQDLTETRIQARELEAYAQELAQLNQMNQQQLTKLQEATQARERFYSLVSHELKTPLTSLKAACEMISSGGLVPEEAKDAWRLIGSMRRSLVRLERTVSDLLDVASAKGGSLSLDVGPVNLGAVISAVCDEMAHLAAEKGVSIETPGKRRGPVVRGDEVRLQQVVQNLLSNAIKATPQGGAIRISVNRNPKYGEAVFTNPGELDEKIRPFLFQPFTKSSVGGYKAGAGLGLSVVDALVKAHCGTVAVMPGHGMVGFSFTIPLWEGRSYVGREGST